MTTVGPGTETLARVQQKYIEERDKRLRPDTAAQFVKLDDPVDPWVDHAALNARTPPIRDGDDIKFVVLGAGFGGLLFAVHLIKAGFKAADIRLADEAGGFGGTWYWNRYPGAMCDTESYIYMPLLEETGYMPRYKYAYGWELLEYAQRIADKWDLADKGMFRTRYHEAVWDDGAKRWRIKATEYRGPSEPSREIQFTAQYVLMAVGILVAPQIPRLPGLERFGGQHFHTSRWDYGITGGSPSEWALERLKDKRVGIIGTGATAIQAIPHLAKWAKHLYVFQRTPSSVDVRGQRPTDPEEWTTKIASAKGWQQARSNNFNSFIVNTPMDEDLVQDGWTRMPAYCGTMGARITSKGFVSPDEIPQHIATLHANDLPRAERVRARTNEVVDDPDTAEKLKAWYPVWCKRPTFHDDYLPAFNRPNVTLIDTDGKGVEALTNEQVVANGTAYPVDVLILSTGFFAPFDLNRSPAHRGNMRVVGRNGLSMDDKWLQEGATTLHGWATHDFPNFFFTSVSQTGLTANLTCSLEAMASYVAATLAEAEQRAQQSDKLTVEVTKAAEDAWSMEVAKRATWFAGIPGCTPGYFNNEAKILDTKEQVRSARGAIWGEGVVSFLEVLSSWRSESVLNGFEIEADGQAVQ
ncbi:flavin-binding monooxygenase-like family protein [Mycena rebaudengoi]|nr:flavin-binding monooxygenase-like family protein [Mycena rebaudengoi]